MEIFQSYKIKKDNHQKEENVNQIEKYKINNYHNGDIKINDKKNSKNNGTIFIHIYQDNEKDQYINIKNIERGSLYALFMRNGNKKIHVSFYDLRNEDGQHNNKEDLCIPHKSENNKAIFFHINGNIIQQEHCAIIHGIKNNNISKYQKEMSIYGFHEKGYYQSEMTI